MQRLFFVITACFCATLAFAQGDPYQGVYAGTLQLDQTHAMPASGEVIMEGDVYYRIRLTGTPESEERENIDIEIYGAAQGNLVNLWGRSDGHYWNGHIQNGKLHATIGGYGLTFDLTRQQPSSPSLGAEPPEDAIVLLPFEKGTPPDLSAWTPSEWEPLEDGSVRVKPRTGGINTVESFGSCRFHLEFLLPLEPLNRGQGRANSGLFFNNLYEVQILDSFGVVSGMGDCGAIYNYARPMVNANMPPLTWQTYDVEFHAPKLNEAGEAVTLPRITVHHNGILIHDDLELQSDTIGKGEHAETGPIALQDHHHPVQFRNIWLVPLDD